MNKNNSTQRPWLISAILAVAIVLHVGFYLSLHEMPLIFSDSSSWKYEDKLVAGSGPDAEDVAKKNVQLAHVFRKVMVDASGGESASSSLDVDSSDFIAPSLDSLLTEWSQVELDLSPLTEWNPPQELARLDLLDVAPAIDIVVFSDKSPSKDLVQATEALLGDVEILTSGLYDPSGARGGRADLASVEGNSLESRSGIRQDGLLDTDFSAYPSLTGSQETGSFENTLRDHVQREQQAYAGQLADGMANPRMHPGMEGHGQHALSGPQSPGHIASSSDFAVKVEYAPRRQGGGYLFRLVLGPKPNVVFKTIKHNIFFLIDRSHSIDKERYAASKMAVMESLDLLREGDTFNLLVFDNQILPFAPESVPVTKRNVSAAKEWLARQPYGGLFASTDLYSSLGNIVPDAVGPQELNTAILLSDGETYLSKDKQRQAIAAWTQKNAGKIALYSLAVGKGNNLPLLDLLTALNRGRLAYSPARDQVGKALGDLMRSVASPIGKDIIGSILVPKDDVRVSLHPPRERLPDLYRDTPYILYGYCTRLEDFYLFLQGHYYDRFLDIKQRISFKEAKQVSGNDLEKQWAIQQAYDLYQKYLADGNAASLTAAKKLLTPYGIPLAFQ